MSQFKTIIRKICIQQKLSQYIQCKQIVDSFLDIYRDQVVDFVLEQLQGPQKTDKQEVLLTLSCLACLVENGLIDSVRSALNSALVCELCYVGLQECLTHQEKQQVCQGMLQVLETLKQQPDISELHQFIDITLGHILARAQQHRDSDAGIEFQVDSGLTLSENPTAATQEHPNSSGEHVADQLGKSTHKMDKESVTRDEYEATTLSHLQVFSQVMSQVILPYVKQGYNDDQATQTMSDRLLVVQRGESEARPLLSRLSAALGGQLPEYLGYAMHAVRCSEDSSQSLGVLEQMVGKVQYYAIERGGVVTSGTRGDCGVEQVVRNGARVWQLLELGHAIVLYSTKHILWQFINLMFYSVDLDVVALFIQDLQGRCFNYLHATTTPDELAKLSVISRNQISQQRCQAIQIVLTNPDILMPPLTQHDETVTDYSQQHTGPQQQHTIYHIHQPFRQGVRHCLIDQDSGVRKLARALVVAACEHVSTQQDTGGQTNKAQKQMVSKYQLFVQLLEGMEDFAAHLIDATWKQISQLHPPTKPQTPSKPHKNPQNKTSSAITPLSFEWMGVLWHSAFQHANVQVTRLAVACFNDRDWGLVDGQSNPYCTSVPLSFIVCVLLPALESLGVSGKARDVQLIKDVQERFLGVYIGCLGVGQRYELLYGLVERMAVEKYTRMGWKVALDVAQLVAESIGVDEREGVHAKDDRGISQGSVFSYCSTIFTKTTQFGGKQYRVQQYNTIVNIIGHALRGVGGSIKHAAYLIGDGIPARVVFNSQQCQRNIYKMLKTIVQGSYDKNLPLTESQHLSNQLSKFTSQVLSLSYTHTTHNPDSSTHHLTSATHPHQQPTRSTPPPKQLPTSQQVALYQPVSSSVGDQGSGGDCSADESVCNGLRTLLCACACIDEAVVQSSFEEIKAQAHHLHNTAYSTSSTSAKTRLLMLVYQCIYGTLLLHQAQHLPHTPLPDEQVPPHTKLVFNLQHCVTSVMPVAQSLLTSETACAEAMVHCVTRDTLTEHTPAGQEQRLVQQGTEGVIQAYGTEGVVQAQDSKPNRGKIGELCGCVKTISMCLELATHVATLLLWVIESGVDTTPRQRGSEYRARVFTASTTLVLSARDVQQLNGLIQLMQQLMLTCHAMVSETLIAPLAQACFSPVYSKSPLSTAWMHVVYHLFTSQIHYQQLSLLVACSPRVHGVLLSGHKTGLLGVQHVQGARATLSLLLRYKQVASERGSVSRAQTMMDGPQHAADTAQWYTMSAVSHYITQLDAQHAERSAHNGGGTRVGGYTQGGVGNIVLLGTSVQLHLYGCEAHCVLDENVQGKLEQTQTTEPKLRTHSRQAQVTTVRFDVGHELSYLHVLMMCVHEMEVIGAHSLDHVHAVTRTALRVALSAPVVMIAACALLATPHITQPQALVQAYQQSAAQIQTHADQCDAVTQPLTQQDVVLRCPALLTVYKDAVDTVVRTIHSRALVALQDAPKKTISMCCTTIATCLLPELMVPSHIAATWYTIHTHANTPTNTREALHSDPSTHTSTQTLHRDKQGNTRRDGSAESPAFAPVVPQAQQVDLYQQLHQNGGAFHTFLKQTLDYALHWPRLMVALAHHLSALAVRYPQLLTWHQDVFRVIALYEGIDPTLWVQNEPELGGGRASGVGGVYNSLCGWCEPNMPELSYSGLRGLDGDTIDALTQTVALPRVLLLCALGEIVKVAATHHALGARAQGSAACTGSTGQHTRESGAQRESQPCQTEPKLDRAPPVGPYTLVNPSQLLVRAAQERVEQVRAFDEYTKAAQHHCYSMFNTILDLALHDESLSSEKYKSHSPLHRLKMRTWQVIAVLAPCVDVCNLQCAFDRVWQAAQCPNMPSVRQYMESALVYWTVLNPGLLSTHVLPVIQQYEQKQEQLQSSMLIATYVLLGNVEWDGGVGARGQRACSNALSAASADEVVDEEWLWYIRQFVCYLLPWATYHHHQARTITQLVMWRVLNAFPPSWGGWQCGPSHPTHHQNGSQDTGSQYSSTHCTNHGPVDDVAEMDTKDPSHSTQNPTRPARDGEVSGRRVKHGVESGGGGAVDGWALQQYLSFLQTNTDMRKLEEGLGQSLFRNDVCQVCSVRQILVSAEQLGEDSKAPQCGLEGAPYTLVDKVIDFLINERMSLRQVQLDAALQGFAPYPRHITSLTPEITNHQPITSVAQSNTFFDNTSVKINEYEDYQRKIVVAGVDAVGAGSTTQDKLGQEYGPGQWPSYLDQNVLDDDDEVCLGDQDQGGQRNQMILVASLIDKVPNLAGLCRTCEVFGATALALASKKVLSDPMFSAVSVTAQQWVRIIEQPPAGLVPWLQQLRGGGFTLIGLEQTLHSKQLVDYRFPSKAVLVLGKEREGIPPEVLSELDVCVEIPQMGFIRSLNVHVSGAIAMYEFLRQKRLHPQQ